MKKDFRDLLNIICIFNNVQHFYIIFAVPGSTVTLNIKEIICIVKSKQADFTLLQLCHQMYDLLWHINYGVCR